MNSRYEFSQFNDHGVFSIYRIAGKHRVFAGLMVSNPIRKRWDIYSHDRNENLHVDFLDHSGGEATIVSTSEVQKQAAAFLDSNLEKS